MSIQKNAEHAIIYKEERLEIENQHWKAIRLLTVSNSNIGIFCEFQTQKREKRKEN